MSSNVVMRTAWCQRYVECCRQCAIFALVSPACRPAQPRHTRTHAPPRADSGALTVINYRPKYVSFDCYGTLINYQIDATTRKVVRGQISDEDWPAFRESFSKYRYDEVLDAYRPYRDVLQD